MTLTPTITEIRERRYSFELTTEQISDLIANACLAAAGLDKAPEGMVLDLGQVSGATVGFTVLLDDQPDMPRITVPPADTVDPSKTPIHAQQALSSRASAQEGVDEDAPTTKSYNEQDKRHMHWDALNADERQNVEHLEKLPHTFSPVQDLNIAQCHIAGVKIPVIASEMGETTEDVTARFNAMQCAATLGASGKPSIDGQRRLLVALRYRAGHL